MKHPLVDRLSAQLKELMYELTVDIPEQLKYARGLGDLSENAEYEMTKERQLFVESRIKQLEELLLKIQSINLDNLPENRVAYGSRVKVEDVATGEARSFLVVFPGEEPEHKKENDILVTVGSPVAQALFGKSLGDEVRVRLPKGNYEWEIIELQTFNELSEKKSTGK